MKILITGATGLIGTALVKKLRAGNHEVNILTRKKSGDKNEFIWNLKKNEIDEAAFKNIDSIVHLAGASVGKRWTEDYKKELYSSRIDSALLLYKTCVKLNIKLKSYISASGVNYYGTYTSDKILTEKDPVQHQDFLSELSVAWENSADEFQSIAERVVWMRTAVVLAKKGGTFPLLKKITDYNIGSGIGSGNQWMNWIHLDDLVDMYIFAIENPEVAGKYNSVADEFITNETFMKKLAKASDKFFLPVNVPAFIMNLVMGEMAEIITEGTRADNQKIKNTGFQFKYNTFDSALKDLI